jgi:hypothetical protein
MSGSRCRESRCCPGAWRPPPTRNIRAQGYVPLNAADGQRILLVETPRSFRGGLSFIF